MEDFQILIGILATGSISINIFLVRQVGNLCERISHLEGKLSSQA